MAFSPIKLNILVGLKSAISGLDFSELVESGFFGYRDAPRTTDDIVSAILPITEDLDSFICLLRYSALSVRSGCSFLPLG